MTIEINDLLTIIVFIWFGIGAFASGVSIMVSMGFTGRFPPEAIWLFFLAPLLLLARVLGPFIWMVPLLAVAGGIAWLFRWAIS